MVHVWLRDEFRSTERRTPLTVEGAKTLLDAGFKVTVEESSNRIIANQGYRDAGCDMAPSGSWTDAPTDAIILGLKELPETPSTLPHSHIYFAHAYKDQSGWKELLGRFHRAGGDLLDLEFLVDENKRRVSAFGHWAGYMGAALALIHWCAKEAGKGTGISEPLTPYEDADTLNKVIAEYVENAPRRPKALVLGALGRSGKGAVEIFENHGIEVTKWDKDETNPLDRTALLNHDILVNCALVFGDIPPFFTAEDIKADTNLAVVGDVSCDPFSDFNPLPFYDEPTSWDNAAITIDRGNEKPFDLTAIDNLPSLLPKESSEDFAAQLLPHLLTLGQRDENPVWKGAADLFKEKCTSLDEE